MGSPSELTLECRLSVHASPSVFTATSLVAGEWDQMQKLQDYLKGLEEEHLKIEAFKTELPLCMQLLNDTIEASKEQLAKYKSTPEKPNCSIKEEENGSGSNYRAALEEFIPINKSCEESGKKSEEPELKKARYAKDDRPDWTSSAQLWSKKHEAKETTVRQQHSRLEQTLPMNPEFFLDSKHRVGGAFVPFSRERQGTSRCGVDRTVPDLALSSREQEAGSPVRCNESGNFNKTNSRNKPKETQNEFIPKTIGTNPSLTEESQPAGQIQRKARRCWSPELHQRFVNALQQLGGSQVSTPKQIREAMKVDGLTNDEVKSHLQKYRLHSRRPRPTPRPVAPQAPQLVVVGGIWVSPEYAAHQNPGLYSPLSTTSTRSHSHYCQPSFRPQEIYSQMNQSSQSDPYPCDLQKQTASHSLVSPQCTGHASSGARGMFAQGDREESTEEDGKSETTSSCKEEDKNVQMTEFGRRLSLIRQSHEQSVGDDEHEEDRRDSETVLGF